ncbi:MAG: carboxypeptidase regulatory-like domain-containing protein [Candidatus Cloacimonadaceae bacterium]
MNRYNLTLMFCLLLLTFSLSAIDITVGAGDEQNRIPLNFNYRFSLYETLYYPSELTQAGRITAISYYNNFPDYPNTSQHVQFWMGMTTQSDLSAGWITSTEMIMVFNGHVIFPNGENIITITLNEPFQYTGNNLVILSRIPSVSPWTANPLNFYCQTVGTNRSREFYSDSINPDPAVPPLNGTNLTISGQFPKTTFHFLDTQLINDLAAVSLTGNTILERGKPYLYEVEIANAGFDHHSIYSVELRKQDDTLLAVADGVFVPSGEAVQIPINWTPDFEGYASIYAKVNFSLDQNSFNDVSPLFDIQVYPPADTILVPPTNFTYRIPMDFYWRTSLFQMIFTPDISDAMRLHPDRVISDIQFYNNFQTNLPDKETKIWLGTTTLTDLSNGWIPSSELTLVYDGLVDYPAGENVINISLQNPYLYAGNNLVMLVMRPFDSSQFTSPLEYFYCYEGSEFTSRVLMSDYMSFDTNALPTPGYSLINKYPKTTFSYAYDSLGSLSGKVCNAQDIPISGATVQLSLSGATVLTSDTGAFHFPWLQPGSYQLTVSADGYLSQTIDVLVTAGQYVYLEIRLLTASDLILVTGRIVDNDNPALGIEDAMIELTSGAYDIVVSDPDGYFSISGLTANQTYGICVRHPNYCNCNMTFTTGAQNTNLGDILMIPYVGIDPNVETMYVTALYGCYPNPVRNQTTISYEVKDPVRTSIEIYNIKGQKVTILTDNLLKSGRHSLVWNGSDSNGKAVSNGVYYYKMTAGRFTSTRKMILLK